MTLVALFHKLISLLTGCLPQIVLYANIIFVKKITAWGEKQEPKLNLHLPTLI